MSKYRIIDIWNQIYGDKEEVYDYAGRLIKKCACNNPNSRFQPTIDHIRPLSKGGQDALNNIIICNRITNFEKNDKFPTWNTNGKVFQAHRVKGCSNKYCIVKI